MALADGESITLKDQGAKPRTLPLLPCTFLLKKSL